MTLPGTRNKILLAAFTIGLSLAHCPFSLAQTEPKKEKTSKAEIKKEAPQKDKQEKNREKPKKAQEKIKKGFFHKDNNKETQARVDSPKTATKEEPTRPEFEPDAALISVLKDLNRGLLESSAVSQISDENERFVLGLSKEILAKALSSGKLIANRIVATEDENRVENAITTESWASGEIEVNPEFKGSLAAIWAKRIGGLLTVSIAGNCRDRKAPDGSPVGEFLVVMSARSPVEKGFDIQSQADVTFWLGKLQSVNVESSCIKKTEKEAKSGEKKSQTRASRKKPARAAIAINAKPIQSLAPLLTNRYKQHYELLILTDERRRQLAQSLAEMSIEPPAGKKAATQESKEDATEKIAVADAGDDKPESQVKAQEAKNQPKQVESVAQEEKPKATVNTTQIELQKEALPVKADTPVKPEPVKQEAVNQETARQEPVKQEQQTRVATLPAQTIKAIEQKSTYENKPAFFHEARLDSKLLLPERALAGQYLTVALLDSNKAGESNVELSFNGASLITDNLGQAVYLIPEDSAPGRSLNIALTSRPSELPATVDILHPLNAPEEGEAPRLDRASHLVSSSSILVLDGHNFDGLASGNRVIIDGGSSEGQIIAASPVQLKISLPTTLAPGLHTLCVSTQGKRSNPLAFEYAQASIQNDPREKDNGNKIVVRVLGTQSKVTLRLVNKSPELIKLSQGMETTTTSSGGTDNNAVINVQRLKKGQAKMEAQVEL
jgi:hypothetical protein